MEVAKLRHQIRACKGEVAQAKTQAISDINDMDVISHILTQAM